jgi:tRNA(Ile2)-agmatinylcytidine synthase
MLSLHWMITLHVGIDDTDSPRMGCTTYVASLLVERLNRLGASFVDYPNLVRLNPNVPWKTRGNGALCLRFKCNAGLAEEIKETVTDAVESNSDLSCKGTEPGVVFALGEKVHEDLAVFAQSTIQGIVKMKDALKLIKKHKAEAVGFKTGRGIIGALAAIGETLSGDHSYELIAYRIPENYGTKRQIDAKSVFEMSRKTEPLTFNNVDPEKKRILITPHGPDPILYGIRGKSPSVVKKAHRVVKTLEPVERWTIFRTNHGTDAHLQQVASIKDIQAYHPVIVRGTVSRPPRIIPRRHVIFSVKDATGEVDCAAYEPSGDLRRKAAQLIVEDVVELYGGVRSASLRTPVTVNLEKFKLIRKAQKVVFRNPLCPNCSKRMESMGSGQGFRCSKCGFRSREIKKQAIEERRGLQQRLYVTSPRSQRHLTKPLSRYGLENKRRSRAMVQQWFWVNRNPSFVPADTSGES